jgi:hypothetical protein
VSAWVGRGRAVAAQWPRGTAHRHGDLFSRAYAGEARVRGDLPALDRGHAQSMYRTYFVQDQVLFLYAKP